MYCVPESHVWRLGSALYQYDFKKSDAEKEKLRKEALRVFENTK